MAYLVILILILIVISQREQLSRYENQHARINSLIGDDFGYLRLLMKTWDKDIYSNKEV